MIDAWMHRSRRQCLTLLKLSKSWKKLSKIFWFWIILKFDRLSKILGGFGRFIRETLIISSDSYNIVIKPLLKHAASCAWKGEVRRNIYSILMNGLSIIHTKCFKTTAQHFSAASKYFILNLHNLYKRSRRFHFAISVDSAFQLNLSFNSSESI